MSSERECVMIINRLYSEFVDVLKYRSWLCHDLIFNLVREMADVFDIDDIGGEDVQDGA